MYKAFNSPNGTEIADRLNKAVARLHEYGLKAVIEMPKARMGLRPIDGMIKVTGPAGEPIVLMVEAKRRIDQNTVALAIKERRADEDTLLVVDRLAPEAARALREHRIPFIDGAGNAWLNLPDRLVWVEGRKPVEPIAMNRPLRAFQPKGLEVIFALLVNPDWVTKPTRELAAATGTANGTVAAVLNELADMGFVVRAPGRRGRRILRDARRLIDRWSEGYLQRLQPTTLIGRYRTAHQDGGWWEAVAKRTPGAQLGGEPAAAAMTGYLKPEVVTLYVEGNGAAAMVAGKLHADPKGDVELRRRFWQFDAGTTEHNTVPPILVYADLMGTADARCIEAAKKIREEHFAGLEQA